MISSKMSSSSGNQVNCDGAIEDVTGSIVVGVNDEPNGTRQIEATVELRKSKGDEVAEKRANVPESTSSSDKADGDKPKPPTLMELVTQASSKDPEAQFQAVTAIRNLLCSSDRRLVTPLVNCGVLTILLDCLQQTSNPDLQFEAAWALTNIASGTSGQTKAVVNAGVVPVFVNLIDSPHKNVSGQVVWALGNIAGDGPTLRDYVISLGVIPLLSDFIRSSIPISSLRTATWVIGNLCRSKDLPPSTDALKEILPMLNYLIQHTDTTVLFEAVWAISSATDAGDEIIQIVVDSGIVPKLVSLLLHHDDKVQAGTIRAVGNIVTGTDEQTQTVLDCGALEHFPVLITHPNAKMCKEAIWVISNITAGHHAQKQEVIDADLIPLILEQLDKREFIIQREAAWAICNMMTNGEIEEHAAYLIEVGVFPPLCKMLNCKDAQTINCVLDGINNILNNSGDQLTRACYAIEECGGLDRIEELQYSEDLNMYTKAYNIIEAFFSDEGTRQIEATVELRKSKGDEVAEKRANVPESTSSSDKADGDKPKPPTLMELVTQASSKDPEAQFQAVTAIRNLLCSSDRRLVTPLVNCGVLTILLDCLQQTSNPDLQFEAAWALTNIASGTSGQTKAVVNAGVVPVFVNLIDSPHKNVSGQVVWALGNIAGDGPTLRDYVISLGVIPLLSDFIRSSIPISSLRTATWVIGNLCRSKDLPPSTDALKEILPMLNYLIQHTDTTVLFEAVWAISSATDAGDEIIQIVVDSGIVPKLVSLLLHHDDKVQAGTIRAVGNIVTGTDEQTQTVLDCGALEHFPVLITHPNAKMCKEAIWVISNITAGHHAQKQEVIDADLIPLILEQLDKREFIIQREAAWAICNMMTNGEIEEHAAYLIEVGVFPPLCKMLNCKDAQTINCVLDGINNILNNSGDQLTRACYAIEECGGLDRIEELQYSEDLNMYTKAYNIIEAFFSDEVNDD